MFLFLVIFCSYYNFLLKNQCSAIAAFTTKRNAFSFNAVLSIAPRCTYSKVVLTTVPIERNGNPIPTETPISGALVVIE